MKRVRLPDPRNVRDGKDQNNIDAVTAAQVEKLVRERLDAAVKAATEPLRATIERIDQNRQSIIREKRDLEQAAFKEAEEREAARPKFLPYTKEQGRDPSAYRRLRAEAEKLGIPMRLVENPAERRQGEPSSTYRTDLNYYFYGPAFTGDHAAYLKHKAEAERHGLRFIVAATPDRMPTEAFRKGDGE